MAEFGMPFDFDATAPDPEEYEYSAAEERMVELSKITNGVFPQVRMITENVLSPSAYVGESLRVSPGAGLTVTVAKGIAMVEGTTYVNTTVKTISFEQNNVAQIYDIVVELDLVNQKIIAKKQLRGVGLAVTDAMQRTEYLYQICLATVTIAANAAAVTVAGIQDQRLNTALCIVDNKPICGLVGSAMQADTRMISEQLYQQISENQVAFDRWKTQEQTDFDVWIDGIQGALEGDVAANLALQIANNTAAINRKVSKSTSVAATLTAAGWVGSSAPFTQILSIAAVTATSVQEVKLPVSATLAQIEALQAANIQDGGQAVNSITLKAWGDKPTINIPIEVILRGDL